MKQSFCFVVMILISSSYCLLGQMFAPGSVDWTKVDFSACGNFSTNGKSIKISQIKRSDDPHYESIPEAYIPRRRMGEKIQPTPKLMLLLDVQNLVSETCWPVDVWRNAWAVINKRCTRCHGNGVIEENAKLGIVQVGTTDYPPGRADIVGGLDMRTYESIMRGGVSGQPVKPGSTAASLMYQMIVPLIPNEQKMQRGHGDAQPSDIEAIRAWIANGAPPAPK